MRNLTRRKFLEKAAIAGVGIMGSWGIFSPKRLAEASTVGQPNPLLVPPYLGKPTDRSIAVNIVAGKRPISCFLKYRQEAASGREASWQRTPEVSIPPLTPEEISLKSLAPGARFQYQCVARLKGLGNYQTAAEASFQTRRSGAASFSFAMMSDAHITPFNRERQEILTHIGKAILSRRPDFGFMLGDNIQTFSSHGGPMTEQRFGPILYAHLRHGLGVLPSAVPVFNVLGNWEGENGWHSDKERTWAREARRAFIPTPGPETYGEGGSGIGDYYGFTWGDTLFLVLSVTGYTPNSHAMQSPIGRPDDWTLGETQKAWLHERLARSKARWKLLFIHHTVGGKAGDDVNSRYGRGGGRAAKIGEQAQIHQWMKQYGVQALFYGHDHVFTDIPVDGIHYICVGSAGAPWKFDRTITGYEKYWTPYGFTWVDVAKDRLKVSFIQSDTATPGGTILHSFDMAP